jgi:hypothetical protein
MDIKDLLSKLITTLRQGQEQEIIIVSRQTLVALFSANDVIQ